MKKIILAILLGFALWCIAYGLCYAQPYVRCDQYIGTMGDPDYFKVFVNSVSGVQSPTYIYVGETGDALHYDLASLPAGSHTIKAQACKAANPPWSVEVCTADSSPLVFTKPVPVVVPGIPANMRLTAQ
jgi:hypothetical protein